MAKEINKRKGNNSLALLNTNNIVILHCITVQISSKLKCILYQWHEMLEIIRMRIEAARKGFVDAKLQH